MANGLPLLLLQAHKLLQLPRFVVAADWGKKGKNELMVQEVA